MGNFLRFLKFLKLANSFSCLIISSGHGLPLPGAAGGRHAPATHATSFSAGGTNQRALQDETCRACLDVLHAGRELLHLLRGAFEHRAFGYQAPQGHPARGETYNTRKL